jgi:YD repeat-containing protein
VVQVREVFGEPDMLLQQSQRPPRTPRRRLRARQRDQLGLDLTGHRRGHRRELAFLSLDRGPDIAAGLGEPPRDQAHRLTRDPGPSRDHRPRIDFAQRRVQRKQNPRPPDHRRAADPGRGHPHQRLTILNAQRDWILLLRRHDRSCLAEGRGKDNLPSPTLHQSEQKLAATIYYLHSDGPSLAGRVKTVTDRAGRATSYGYDTVAALTTVTDPLGHAATYSYDGSGRVVAVTDPLGRVTTEDWTTDNQIKTITEPNGAARSYSYNANGYLTDVIDQDGNHTKLTYTDQPLDATDTGTH